MNNLENINFKMYTPCNDLQDYVQAIWFAENPTNTQNMTFKVMSDAGSTIAMNFGDELSYRRCNQSISVNRGSITSGPSTNFLHISFKGKINSIGIHFYPEYAHLFFETTMENLSNKLIRTTSDHFSLIDPLYNNLSSTCFHGQSRGSKISIIEKYLLAALKYSEYTTNNTLVNAMNIVTSNYNISLTDLSLDGCISMREMQRIFKKFGGVSPKEFMRLSRVRDMKSKISQNKFSTLSELALHGGYFDQAHFTREFRQFFDDTPKRYYAYKNK